MVQKGSKGFKRTQKGFNWFKRIQKRFKNVQKGSKRFIRFQKGSKGFRRVQKGTSFTIKQPQKWKLYARIVSLWPDDSCFIGKNGGALANYPYFAGKSGLTEPSGSKFTPFGSRKQKTPIKYLRNRHRARILSATLGESTNLSAFKTRIKVLILHFCNTPRAKMRLLEHSEFQQREPFFE